MTDSNALRPGSSGVARWALTGLAVLPIVVAVVRALTTRWIPIGDSALLALRVDDVGGVHHPWLGSWTSASLSLGIDVNNPGAWYAYLVAPFVSAFGPVAGTALGVGALNVAAIALAACAARRVGGARLEWWCLAGAALLAWSMGSELLFDLWQPHALLLPLYALLFVFVAAAGGQRWAAPVAIGLASLIVQTHLGHVYIVGLLLVVALVLHVVVAGRPDRRLLVVSGVVAVMAWLPAVVEQLSGAGQGNLSRLAESLGSDTELTLGASYSARIAAAVFALPPWWTRAGFEDTLVVTPRTDTPAGLRLFLSDLPAGWLAALALLLLLGLLAAIAWTRRRDAADRAAPIIAIVAVLGSLASLSILVIGPVGFAPHHARWTFPLAVFIHVVLVEAAARRVRWDGVRWVPLALVAAATLANLPTFAQPQGPVADRAATDQIRRVIDDMDALVPIVGNGPIRYETSNFRVYEPFSGAVMMRLGELAIDFRVVDDGWVRQLGDARRADGDERATLIQLEGDAALAAPEEWCTIAFDDPGPSLGAPFGLFLDLGSGGDAAGEGCP